MKNLYQYQPFTFGIILAAMFAAGFFVSFIYVSRTVNLRMAQATVGEGVQSQDFKIFWEVWRTLQEKYPFDNEEPPVKDRIYAATEGMVRSFGDPHTLFLQPKETKMFAQDVQGDFGGVGMEVGMRDNVPVVIAALKDSPAEDAGVRSGDVIYKIDGYEVLNLSIDQVISKIRGDVDTDVSITFLREGESAPFDVMMTREVIMTPVIHTIVHNDIFVIQLYSFNTHAVAEFKKALDAFHAGNYQKLVIDMRSNPGGFFDAAIDISSMMLPEGTVVVRQRPGNQTGEDIFRSRGYDLVDSQVPIVVLVDGGSASASEIVAGALQEAGRAELVGTQTFGKGSVQEFLYMSDESSLKVTVAKWYTPKGISISENGLQPDHVVDLSYEAYAKGVDTQLQAAYDLLAKKGK